MNESMNDCINEWMTQWINTWTTRLPDQSDKKSINQPTAEPTNQQANLPTNYPTDQPIAWVPRQKTNQEKILNPVWRHPCKGEEGFDSLDWLRDGKYEKGRWMPNRSICPLERARKQNKIIMQSRLSLHSTCHPAVRRDGAPQLTPQQPWDTVYGFQPRHFIILWKTAWRHYTEIFNEKDKLMHTVEDCLMLVLYCSFQWYANK